MQWFKVAMISIVVQIGPVNAFGLQAAAGQPHVIQGSALPSNDPNLSALEQALLDAARQSPESFAAQRRLGAFYLQQNRLEAAIPYLVKAQQLDPKNYDNGYDLSLAYLTVGDAAKASILLRDMIKQSETAELHGLLAEAEEKTGDYPGAAQDYYRAAELQPSEDNIFDLSSFLLQHSSYEGFADRALVFLRYGVSKYPRSAKLTVGLGVGLYAQGRYDDAVQTLCAAVDLDPSDPKPFEFLGKVSKASPAYVPEIRRRLEGFVSLYPENGPANYYYAMSLWQSTEGSSQPDFAKIKGLLQKAISVQPDNYEPHFRLGILYQNELKYQDAILEFNRALSLRQDISSAHYRLAIIYGRTHQKQLADEQFAILKQLKQQDVEAEEPENHAGNRTTNQAADKPN